MLDPALQAQIDEHVELIKYSQRAVKEAADRATSFLVMVAFLTEARRACEEDRIKLSTMVSLSHAQAWGKLPDNKVTEKKILVDSDSAYNEFREALERCEQEIVKIKAYIEVFNNAHILYRNFAKE
jgi:hypothetical protein